MFNSANPYENEITIEGIEKFLSIHGQRGAKTLSLAGKQRPFIEALSSKMGQELLRDMMVRMEVILDKIIEETVSKEELAEYRVLRDIFKKWAKRIMIFEETKKKIKEERHG